QPQTGRVRRVVHVEVVRARVLDDGERELAVDVGAAAGVWVEGHHDRAGCRGRGDVDMGCGDRVYPLTVIVQQIWPRPGLMRRVPVPTPSGTTAAPRRIVGDTTTSSDSVRTAGRRGFGCSAVPPASALPPHRARAVSSVSVISAFMPLGLVIT